MDTNSIKGKMGQFMTSLLSLVILCFSSLILKSDSVFSPSANHLCRPDEALSLLQFKDEMHDFNASNSYASTYCEVFGGQNSYPKMISWNKDASSDCCTWDGVTCHGITGHVIGLDMSCSRLEGIFHKNSSLFQLSRLQKLNLAHNSFSGSEISPNIGGLSRLTHLDLSFSNFQGIVPQELFHLSKLAVLDLSSWSPPTLLRFNPGDFHILLQNLTGIKVLYLDDVDISTTLPANWSSSMTNLSLVRAGARGKLSNSIFHLPRLQTLVLFGNRNLTIVLPKSNCSNISPLRVLDLSFTNFLSDGINDLIGALPFLNWLDLSGCGLSGSLPNSIGNLSEIELLDLSYNNLTGKILSAISNLTKLRTLDLSTNSFTGQFPSHIGKPIELTDLSLKSNSFSGPLPSYISGFRKLQFLDISNNLFDGGIPSWLFSIPCLTHLSLSHNQLDGPIPDSIGQLVNLTGLDLSFNNLSGVVEFTIFSRLNKLEFLSLSGNKLSLKIDQDQTNISFPHLQIVALSSCEITEFPHFLKNSKSLFNLDLSNNKIHGQIPNWILYGSLEHVNLSCNSFSSLESPNTFLPVINYLDILDLRSNLFQEPLPLFFCHFQKLYILDLSHNSFTDSIPECFGNFSSDLVVLNLAKNDLKGTISITFPKDNLLRYINLNGNSLEGQLPRSLANCKFLEVLDVGNNKINDTFPTFLENLTKLQVLILKFNRFSGSIRRFKKEDFLSQLRVLDLSGNEFTGVLPPQLLKSFKAMVTSSKIEPNSSYMGVPGVGTYHYSISLVMKGQAFELAEILTTLVAIDLSSNKFVGDIPEIIGDMNPLILLNLSHNNFSGHIPPALGKLHFLESLDLSCNQIGGEIPWQLADLTSLGFLNLSQNHLVGCIPLGKQFNTFLNDSYYGNMGLSGFPVTKDCGEMHLPSPSFQISYQDNEDSTFWSEFTWKSVLIGYSFGSIFGFAIGCLVYFTGKPKWLASILEELCWYGLLFFGKTRMAKQQKKSRRGLKHSRRNN